jgi:predicted house-cleaning noncanonical NTP pyrophosphatase (MazG superfamily)
MAETLNNIIEVIEKIATANFSDSLLSKNRISEAMMTAGVAPR